MSYSPVLVSHRSLEIYRELCVLHLGHHNQFWLIEENLRKLSEGYAALLIALIKACKQSELYELNLENVGHPCSTSVSPSLADDTDRSMFRLRRLCASDFL